MLRRTTVIAAAALVGLAPLGATAGEGFYATVNAGAAYTKDASNTGGSGALSFNVESEYDTGLFVSGAVGHQWAQGFAAEGEILYSSADIDSLTLTSVGGTGVAATGNVSDGDVSTLGFMVNGAYNHDTGTQWTPFVMGGIGVAQVSANDVNVSGVLLVDDDDTVFAYQVGAGVNFAVNKQFGIGVAYRFFGTADPTLTDAAGGEFDSEHSQHIFTVRGTVNF